MGNVKPLESVADGKVEVIGPELSDVPAGTRLPLAIVAEVAGRTMQDDYEPFSNARSIIS